MQTPFDAKKARLKERLASGKGNQDRIKRKLQNTKARQYMYQQKNAPDPVQPWNTQYEQQTNMLGEQRDQAMEVIGNQQRTVENQFGFLDPSNPYSRAAALQRSKQMSEQTSLNEFGQQGQIYSGAYQRRADADLTNYGAERTALQGEYQQALDALTGAGLEADTAYNQGILGAEQARLEASLAQRPDAAPKTPGFVKAFKKRQKKNKNKPRNNQTAYNNEGRPS